MPQEQVKACPEVTQMLLEAAVMDLEDALAGRCLTDGPVRACLQRIKNMLDRLQADEPGNGEEIMKQTKVFPGYTQFYTYHRGERTILMERTRHAQGGQVVHRQVLEFDTAVEAQRHFDTQCGV
jgi:hypothetical protein